MTASIFIPTTNNTVALQACLDSLRKQTVKNFTVIMVSTKKDQHIAKVVNQYKDLHMVYMVQKKSGLLQAANEALALTKTDIFIRIDDDTILSTDWLKEILIPFNNPAVGAVTGPTLIPAKNRQARDLISTIEKTRQSKNPLLAFFYLFIYSYLYEKKLHKVSLFCKSGCFTLGANFPESLRLKKSLSVQNIEACNFAIRTALLKKLHGFDRLFQFGLSDYHEADVACKLRKAGEIIMFNPKAHLLHNVSLSQTPRSDSYNRIRNFVMFYRRHIGIKNLDYLFRFLANLLLQNLYYVSKGQLGSIPGSLAGFFVDVRYEKI